MMDTVIDIKNFKMTAYEKFKIGSFIILVTGFLYCLYGYSENGKYVFHKESSQVILNSRTGEIFNIKNKNRIQIENFKIKK